MLKWTSFVWGGCFPNLVNNCIWKKLGDGLYWTLGCVEILCLIPGSNSDCGSGGGVSDAFNAANIIYGDTLRYLVWKCLIPRSNSPSIQQILVSYFLRIVQIFGKAILKYFEIFWYYIQSRVVMPWIRQKLFRYLILRYFEIV